MIRVLILLLCLAAPAQATQDQWPALFDVSGVAADDVLNIRAGPSADSEIVGTLAHDARGVEIVRPNDRHTWGMVNTGEGTGWVSLAYVTRGPGQWYGAEITRAFCSGTEPFWSFDIDGTSAAWSTPETTATGQVLDRAFSMSRRDEQGATFRLNDGEDGVALLRLASCNDGMSDREFGIAVSIVKGGTEGPTLYSGCCSLSP